MAMSPNINSVLRAGISELEGIPNWHLDMKDWTHVESKKFVEWFAEVGTSLGSMAEVIEGYRAVRDVEASVEEPRGTERYAYGWTDTRGIFGSKV